MSVAVHFMHLLLLVGPGTPHAVSPALAYAVSGPLSPTPSAIPRQSTTTPCAQPDSSADQLLGKPCFQNTSLSGSRKVHCTLFVPYQIRQQNKGETLGLDLHCLILSVISPLAGFQNSCRGLPGCGFLKSTSITFSGGGSAFANICVLTSVAHVAVVNPINSLLRTRT